MTLLPNTAKTVAGTTAVGGERKRERVQSSKLGANWETFVKSKD